MFWGPPDPYRREPPGLRPWPNWGMLWAIHSSRHHPYRDVQVLWYGSVTG